MIRTTGIINTPIGGIRDANIYAINRDSVVLVDPAVNQSTAYQKTLLSYDPKMPVIKRGVDQKIRNQQVFGKSRQKIKSVINKQQINPADNPTTPEEYFEALKNLFGGIMEVDPKKPLDHMSTDSKTHSSHMSLDNTSHINNYIDDITMASSMNEGSEMSLDEQIASIASIEPDNETLNIVQKVSTERNAPKNLEKKSRPIFKNTLSDIAEETVIYEKVNVNPKVTDRVSKPKPSEADSLPEEKLVKINELVDQIVPKVDAILKSHTIIMTTSLPEVKQAVEQDVPKVKKTPQEEEQEYQEQVKRYEAERRRLKKSKQIKYSGVGYGNSSRDRESILKSKAPSQAEIKLKKLVTEKAWKEITKGGSTPTERVGIFDQQCKEKGTQVVMDEIALGAVRDANKIDVSFEEMKVMKAQSGQTHYEETMEVDGTQPSNRVNKKVKTNNQFKFGANLTTSTLTGKPIRSEFMYQP